MRRPGHRGSARDGGGVVIGTLTQPDDDDLRPEIEPLTADEVKWCRKLARLLAEAPPRLMLATIGDPRLYVYDQAAALSALDEAGERDLVTIGGLQLGTIHGRIKIAGVAG